MSDFWKWYWLLLERGFATMPAISQHATWRSAQISSPSYQLHTPSRLPRILSVRHFLLHSYDVLTFVLFLKSVAPTSITNDSHRHEDIFTLLFLPLLLQFLIFKPIMIMSIGRWLLWVSLFLTCDNLSKHINVSYSTQSSFLYCVSCCYRYIPC